MRKSLKMDQVIVRKATILNGVEAVKLENLKIGKKRVRVQVLLINRELRIRQPWMLSSKYCRLNCASVLQCFDIILVDFAPFSSFVVFCIFDGVWENCCRMILFPHSHEDPNLCMCASENYCVYSFTGRPTCGILFTKGHLDRKSPAPLNSCSHVRDSFTESWRWTNKYVYYYIYYYYYVW